AIREMHGRPRRRRGQAVGYNIPVSNFAPGQLFYWQGSYSGSISFTHTVEPTEGGDWTPLGRLEALDSITVRHPPADCPLLITWNGTPLTRDQYRHLTDTEPPPNNGPLAQLQEHAAERPCLSFRESLTAFGRTV